MDLCVVLESAEQVVEMYVCVDCDLMSLRTIVYVLSSFVNLCSDCVCNVIYFVLSMGLNFIL